MILIPSTFVLFATPPAPPDPTATMGQCNRHTMKQSASVAASQRITADGADMESMTRGNG